jgi:spermidine/putrescine transport system permease protein
LWVAIFLLLPLLGIVAISFAGRGDYGDVQGRFTLENFRRFLGFGALGFDPLYPTIIARTLAMAGGTTLVCVLASLPLAFFIAALPARLKRLGLMLVVIPFWTNLLIRTYAWQILFSSSGWFARAAAGLGLIQPGDSLYPGSLAVFVVLACDFLPMLTLPLYASVEKIDWTLAEAARDLGANSPRVFWHALLPQVRPGLVAGSILVFIAATGQFAIPDLMGGARTVLIGNVIQQQFGFSRDWPFGSAIACLTMTLVLVGLWVFARNAGETRRKERL